MKVKALKVAKEKGIKKIKTMNETRNEDILFINKKTGFKKKLTWVDFDKEIEYGVKVNKVRLSKNFTPN